MIHTRAAAEDTIRIMKEEGAGEAGGVMHCFTETWDVAQSAMDQGFFISFSGIVTFRSADSLREVARALPHDRVLIETDTPYLAPVPFRGRDNEPAYVVKIAELLATLWSVPLEEVAARTTANFEAAFSVKLAR